MREAGVASRQRRRHKYKSSGVEALVAPHLLKRKFDVTQVNQVWCGDATYIKVGTRWMYFAAVLDLFAHRGVVVLNDFRYLAYLRGPTDGR